MNTKQINCLIEAMNAAGYLFDDPSVYCADEDCYPEELRFMPINSGIPVYFIDWNEVETWLNGAYFDNVEIKAKVYEILKSINT